MDDKTGLASLVSPVFLRLRICFEMVHENYYSLFFDGFFDNFQPQWGSIEDEKYRKIRGKEA